MMSHLTLKTQDAPEFIAELAEYLIKSLNKIHLEVVCSVFMSSTSSTSGTGRKYTIKDLQEDSALILHLTLSPVSVLNLPCVPQITALPNRKIPDDQNMLLVKYQGLDETRQGDDPWSDELDKEQQDITSATHKELQELSSSIKDRQRPRFCDQGQSPPSPPDGSALILQQPFVEHL
ncbi:hypothetical protein GH733_016894, partial [Mirounga leonina]